MTNLEYAPLAEQMGHIGWASEVFNCSAPDTGNMEVLMRYGTREHKNKWLRPLMDGEIRSAFLMTEPAVASSDATNIETSHRARRRSLRDQRPQMVVVRRRRSPLQNPDPDGQDRQIAPRHQQQSQILVPRDGKGITVEKMLPVFGFDDAPHGHAQVLLENVRVPAEQYPARRGQGL